jgi:hypothetical protein
MGRALALLRFYLGGHGASQLPVAAVLLPAALSGTLALLIRSDLTPFAFAVCAFSLMVALVAIPLLGELGYLLRADASAEWVEALPLAPRDVRTARALHLVVALGLLALGSLAPAALFAPSELGVLGRIGLVLGGLGLATVLTALLLSAQALLGGRAEPVFILLQTLLVGGVIVGVVLGLQRVHVIAKLDGVEPGSALAWFPPAWFAAPFGRPADGSSAAARALLPLALSAGALLLVLFLPRPAVVPPRRSRTLSERLLAPVRALATRFWVGADERGPFDLVYDAVPREREFVLRTYPMLGIPLAFLVAATVGENGGDREALLALLLFTPGVYLPVLLSQLPASQSHEARWLLDGAPVAEGALSNGAIKALTVRFLVPLYVGLGLLATYEAGPLFALRLTLPAALASLLVMRRLYALCVTDHPLSIAPDRLQTRLEWGGTLFGVAFVLTIVAWLAYRFLGPLEAAGVVVALALAEWTAGRALRRQRG